jgi:hypothetical protein
VSDFDNPLQPVVGQWIAKIKLAADFKNARFGKDADEAMRFFVGAFDWVYKGVKSDRHFQMVGEVSTPTFQMSLNKTAELVQLFGPSLYARNPVRVVTPRKWPDLPPTAFGDVRHGPRRRPDVPAGGDGHAAGAGAGRHPRPDHQQLPQLHAERPGPEDGEPVGDRRGDHQGHGLPVARQVQAGRRSVHAHRLVLRQRG